MYQAEFTCLLLRDYPKGGEGGGGKWTFILPRATSFAIFYLRTSAWSLSDFRSYMKLECLLETG